MKNYGKYLIFFLIALLAALSVYLLRPSQAHDRQPASLPELKAPGKPRPALGEARPNGPTVPVPGVGDIPYATRHLNYPTVDWLRKSMERRELPAEAQDDMIRWRDINNRWPKTDVYYGPNAEILHIEVNKAAYLTHPMDSEAIRQMREIKGLEIVRTGFPQELLDSGYTMQDFLWDTEEHWDNGGGSDGFATEITPVIVRVTAADSSKTGVRDPSLLDKEYPMILVKRSTDPTSDSLRSQNPLEDPWFEVFSNEEICHSTWVLEEYAGTKSADPPVNVRLRGSALIFEPLLEAWNKHQAGQTSDKK